MHTAGLAITQFRGAITIELGTGYTDGTIGIEGYNALSRQLADALDNDKVSAVVLHGVEGCFCRGGNIAELLDEETHPELVESVTEAFHTLSSFGKPLIAIVEGEATGVGCSMLFHCDIVLASETSKFSAPFVDFGLVPEAAASILAPEQLGYRQAFRFFCLGESLSAEKAIKLGLVSELIESGQAHARVAELCRRLSRKPLASLTLTKALLKSRDGDLNHRIDTEIAHFRKRLSDPATKRRMALISSRIR
jgi:enoyl-CoA hydratase/carnithine racemase